MRAVCTGGNTYRYIHTDIYICGKGSKALTNFNLFTFICVCKIVGCGLILVSTHTGEKKSRRYQGALARGYRAL